jgi:hypothetical protein
MRIPSTSSPICLLLALAILAIAIAGCFSSTTTHRGPLSDAVGKASDDNTGSRTVDTPPTSGPSEDERERERKREREREWEREREREREAASIAAAPADTTPMISVMRVRSDSAESGMPEEKSTYVPWLSLVGGTGLIAKDGFSAFNNGALQLAVFQRDRLRAELLFGLGFAGLKESGELAKSIRDNMPIASAGVQVRWFTTPQYTLLGHYLFGGLAYSYMMWDYKHSITSGSDYISSDALQGGDLFVGTGVNVVQTPAVQLGVELCGGVMAWDNTTREGFDNDIFAGFPYLKLRVVLSLNVKPGK